MKIQTINVNWDPDIVCLCICTDQDHLYNLLDKKVGGNTYINSKLP